MILTNVNVQEDDVGLKLVVLKVEDFFDLNDVIMNSPVDFFDVVKLKDYVVLVSHKHSRVNYIISYISIKIILFSSFDFHKK